MILWKKNEGKVIESIERNQKKVFCGIFTTDMTLKQQNMFKNNIFLLSVNKFETKYIPFCILV